MHDGAVTFGRWYRLAPRGGAGLSCDRDGVALGPIALIHRTSASEEGTRYVARQPAEVARALGLAYRDMSETELERCLAGLDRIIEALDRGDYSLAAIMAIQLRLPEIDAVGMAKLAKAVELHKYNPDQPRVPAGNRDGGQWTSAGETVGAELAQATGKERVQLPIGRRNDELGDLLEWIANARPEDRAAIHAEIKRLYFDVGDSFGGGAMEQALQDAMDATSRADRERILRDYEPYTHGEPADVAQSRAALSGAALLAPLLGEGSAAQALAPSVAETASDVWKLGWAARGRQIEQALGADLPANFPVIDAFADGVATSIKSIDLKSAIYSDADRLSTRIDAYVGQLAAFKGEEWGKRVIAPTDITERVLKIAIPKGTISRVQQSTIDAAGSRAQERGITLLIVPF